MNPLRRLIALTFLALSSLLLTFPAAYAQIPPLVRYQGTLTDSGGADLDGSYNLTFRFYDAETGGTKTWEETQSAVPVQKGSFGVLLGSVAPLALRFDADSWLAVSVNGGAELTPRHRVASVPNAYLADRSERLDRSERIQTANLVRNGSMESWSGGATEPPNQWALSGSGAAVSKQTSACRFGKAALNLTNAAGLAATLSQTVLIISLTESTEFLGKTVTASAWAKASVAGTARIELEDGVGSSPSSPHPGDGTWRLLTVTRTLDPAASRLALQLRVEGASSSMATFDGVTLVEGPMPFAFCLNANDEYVRVSNFKAATGVQTFGDQPDQGVWRMEMGELTHTLNASGAESTGIVLREAFRTVRIALVSSASTGYWQIRALGTWGVNIRTDNGPPNTAVSARWIVIGQD